MFLCYDIRGIQTFIFQIPRLKYIIGGSALIDRFDRQQAPDIGKKFDVELICAGGGKGAFRCVPEKIDDMQNALVAAAHEFGADIRFGIHDDYSEAMHCADKLYPALPGNLKGHPCKESGLYPTRSDDAHELVQCRDGNREKEVVRYFERRLLMKEENKRILKFPPGLVSGELTFMRDVEEGTPGCLALGNRNRWAIICMDGNDMGRQFGAMANLQPDEATMVKWVRKFSKALDECSESACLAGMQRVLAEWTGDEKVGKALHRGDFQDEKDANRIVVPLRPLVVGGDDIAVLCHSAHAAAFVKEACRAFREKSRELAEKELEESKIKLWPATGDFVTISAGIVYCGTSLPLATAIPYAENLLALAKTKGRLIGGIPSPACVDFEAITESMLDAPKTRRLREMVFFDADIQEQVELTCRPYTLEAFEAITDEATNLDIPNSILHQLLPSVRAGYHDRQVFRWRIGKRREWLFDALNEESNKVGSGKSRWRMETLKDGKRCRRTDLVDLALLAQEQGRMEKETVQ